MRSSRKDGSLLASVSTDPGLFLDVEHDLLEQPPTQPVVERLVRVRQTQGAPWVR